MSIVSSLVAAVITAQPVVSAEVLEPSVMNEVEHALERAPKAVKFSTHEFIPDGTASEKAIALVSTQRPDGRWLAGTEDVTFAVVSELKRLAYGDGSFRILMIGNSFSICNCRHMPKVCQDLGIRLELGSLYIGGCSLERHWQNVVAATNADFAPYRYDFYRDGREEIANGKANIPQILGSRRWDVVTLQQASHYSWRPESYHPFGDDLVKTIRELAPQAEIVVQETWSYTPWDGRLAKWGIDQNEMYSKLHEAYGAFASGYGFRVIPFGTAVQEWRRRLPVRYTENSLGGDVVGGGQGPQRKGGVFKKDESGKWVPNADMFHLGAGGQYFQSLVWTAYIFGIDVGKCAYRPEFVSESEAKLMKTIATESGTAK